MNLRPIIVTALVGYIIQQFMKRDSERPTVPNGVIAKGKVAREQTGRSASIPDGKTWARTRFDAALAVIKNLLPFDPGPEHTREIALSVVGQWAHESAHGMNEFNFNAGGMKAAPGETHFTALGSEEGDAGKTIMRWRAFPNIETFAQAYADKLVRKWPAAVEALAKRPTSDEWIRLLAVAPPKYYTAPPEKYAARFRANRAWVVSMLGTGPQQA